MQQVAPPSHPMYNFSDPKRVGPGTWYMFMLMSANAKTRGERVAVCNHIRLFCEFFKCSECSGHCKKYIEENNPEETICSERGLFDWVVTFMNAVNYRLGKPAYDKDTLYRMVTEKGLNVCTSDCGGGHQEKKTTTLQKKYVVTKQVSNKGSLTLTRLGKF